MMRTVVIVGTLLLGVGAVVAQQDLVKVAQTQMKGNGKNAGALGAMVKGEKPYDQATVDAAFAQFEDTAKKLPTLFPDSIKGLKADGDYSSTAKVWEDKAGFAEIMTIVQDGDSVSMLLRHFDGGLKRAWEERAAPMRFTASSCAGSSEIGRAHV